MSLFDMSGEIDALATDDLTISRPSTGFDANGRRTNSAASTFPARASVQPASGRDLQRLPEGDRDREALTVFTSAVLHTGDRFTYGGEAFEVGHVDRWQAGNFHKAIASKVG
jgi:hypothetical protein